VWAGLGYYRRAALLHNGARTVVEKMNGVIPDTVQGLLAVPGVRGLQRFV
jgi:A/G-specific adenine glycosylase